MVDTHQRGRQWKVLLHVQSMAGHAIHMALFILDKRLRVLPLQQASFIDNMLNLACRGGTERGIYTHRLVQLYIHWSTYTNTHTHTHTYTQTHTADLATARKHSTIEGVS